jgi:hypothetical protein
MSSRTKSEGQISRIDSARGRQNSHQIDDVHPVNSHGADFAARGEASPEGSSLEPNDEDTETHITFTNDVRGPEETPSSPGRRRMRPPYSNVQSLAATQNGLEDGHGENSDGEDDSHLHFLRKFSRNSSFHHLSERERQKLGGAEYRAVSLLSVIVPVYFLLWQLLGGLGVGAYVARNKAALAKSNGLNPWRVFISCVTVNFSNLCLDLGGWASSSPFLPSTTLG